MSCTTCTPAANSAEETYVNAFPCVTVCSSGATAPTPTGGASTVTTGTITNSAITGGTITGATLIGCVVGTSTWTGGTITNPIIAGGTMSSTVLSGVTIQTNSSFIGGSFANGTFTTPAIVNPTVTGGGSYTGGTFTGPTITSVNITSGDIAGVAIDNCAVTNLPAPAAADDAATKQYVDSVASGFTPTEAVRIASTANLAALAGLLTIDGVTLIANDRVLVKDQTLPEENGIYVAAAGAWSRSLDANTAGEVAPGLVVSVQEGTVWAGSTWVVTEPAVVTLGTDPLVWVLFSSLGSSIPGTRIQAGTLTAAALADGSLNDAVKFATTLRPVEVGGTLPSSGNFSGRMFFLTTNAKLYRHTGNPLGGTTGWTAAVPTVDLTGKITTTQITEGAITTPLLSALAVEADNIAANAITSGKIAADAVVAGTIAAGAINATGIVADDVLVGDELVVGVRLRAPKIETGILYFDATAAYSQQLICCTTANDNDYSLIRMNGGGSNGRGRGGQIDVFGNEFQQTEDGQLYGGSVLITPGDGKSGSATQTGVVYIRDNAGNSRIRIEADQGVWLEGNITLMDGGAKLNINQTTGITSDGPIQASGFVATSTRKLKKEIDPLDGATALELVEKLQGVWFDWAGGPNAGITDDIGFIAEDVDKILPTFVAKDKDGEARGVDYGRVTAVLVEAVKFLSARVTELEKKLGA